MGFREKSLNVVINILVVFMLIALAVVETIVLIIPAIIAAFIIDRWPRWMWGATKKLADQLPATKIEEPMKFRRR